MADQNIQKLVAEFQIRTDQFEKALQRIDKRNAAAFQKIVRDGKKSLTGLETALASADRRMAGFGRSLLPGLGAIGAALSTREILRYADAWASAKNSLAVAGVTGRQQLEVLNKLYDAAQRNAAPIGALADLYSKASQAADVLGASQEQLLKFSGGIATALKVAGVSAGQASGALLQLSQLLAAGTVRAQEFNSVNEGARPILQAVAAGMDRAGGSVAKLRNLVVDGKVSSKEFFDSFLRGLPKIEAMGASATDTISQGMTRVTNAFEKFIGETDESLGASARLTQGLNALADNFSTTADFALQLASVIAGALVGRSIVAMIAKVGMATEALIAFGKALAAARTISMASALGSLGAAAGPLGAIIGGVLVGSLVLFSSRSETAAAGAKTYAAALKQVEEAAKDSAKAVDDAGRKFTEQSKNSLTAGVETGTGEIAAARDEAIELFDRLIEAGHALHLVRDEAGNLSRQPLASPEQLAQLTSLRDGLKDGSTEADAAKDALYALANSNPTFQKLADQLAPLLDTLKNAIAATGILKGQLADLGGGPSFRQSENDSMAAYEAMKAAGDKFVADAQKRNALSKDELALETEIAKVKTEAEKAGIELSDKRIKALAEENLAAEKRRSAETKSSRESDYERLTKRINEATAAQEHENEALARANPLAEDFGFALEKARTEAELFAAATADGAEITPELTAEIEKLATKYAQSVSAGNRLADVQDRIRQEAEDMSSMLKGTFQSMVDALFEAGDIGKKLISIFADLGRPYTNMNINQLWDKI